MNFRKPISVAAAAAIAVSVAAVPVSADPVSFSLPVTLNSQNDTKTVQWKLSEFYKDDSSIFKSVKMKGTAPFSSAGWVGGGGAVGISADGGWAQVDFGTDQMKIDGDNWEVTVDFSVKEMNYFGDDCIVQIGWWWGAGDTLTVESFEVEYTSGTVTGAAEEAPAEETTLPADVETADAEEEPEDVAAIDETADVEEEEDTAPAEDEEEDDWDAEELDWDDEEDWGEDFEEEEPAEEASAGNDDGGISAAAPCEYAGAVTVSGPGSTTGAWGQSNVMYTYHNISEDDEPGPNPFDTSLLNEGNVIVVYYESDTAPELILQSWSGGEGWAKVPADESLSKPGTAVFTYEYMTAMYQTEDFTLLDAVNIGDTGNPLSVSGVYVVPVASLSGNSDAAPAAVEESAPAAAEESAPAPAPAPAAPASSDSGSSAPHTGNMPVEALASIVAAAAGAAVLLRKRK